MEAPNVRWRLNTRLLPPLFGVLLLLQIISPYRGWEALLIGLGGAWALSSLWAWHLARHLRMKREMRFGWAQVGDRLVERFTLINECRFPAPWIEIRDHSTLPDYEASRGTGIGANNFIRWHKEALCTRRGLFYLGPMELQTGDPFGIYTVTLSYPHTMPLLVLPPIVPLPPIDIAPGGRTGSGPLRSNPLDRTVSASSVRDYAPGDSLRWIHWKTTARRNALFVRTFDGTPSGDWWILLDMDRDVQVGEGEDSTQELGVILAASLADRGLRAKRSVGLMAYGEELQWLPPNSGEGQRWEILRSLALVSLGDRPISELLHRVQGALGQRTSVIIITPSTHPRWTESLVTLQRQGAVPTVLLLDPISFGGYRKTGAIEARLNQLGIAYGVITRDLLDRPEARPGKQGTWEWRVLGTGKAIPVRRAAEGGWRRLV
ncbi:MAG: DUF58 domain-containing protein [Anaerolineae bacterium]